jgi:hypothetical protein|tara:strand:+ start:185 stop:340 length:156 start_codon:yes stop_codon:yes gene_type:complete
MSGFEPGIAGLWYPNGATEVEHNSFCYFNVENIFLDASREMNILCKRKDVV